MLLPVRLELTCTVDTIRRPTATGTLVGRERIELPEGIPPVLQTGPLPSTVYLPMLVSDQGVEP